MKTKNLYFLIGSMLLILLTACGGVPPSDNNSDAIGGAGEDGENVVTINPFDYEDTLSGMLGAINHGPGLERSYDENGKPLPYIFEYDGGIFELPYYVRATGTAKNIGFLLFLNGSPQPYQINGEGEIAYLHSFELEQDDEVYNFTISFVPVIGQTEETLTFTVASIYYPQFQPDMVQSSSYGMYHDALTGIYQIHFSENTPADSSYSAADNALAALSNVSVDSELMDSEFIQTRLGGLNFVSDQETTENLLDANVYSYVSYNGKTVYSNLDISEQETVHVVYQLCGIPGAEYKISFYANHRLLSDGENSSWEVKLEKGAVVTLEADVRTDQLGDLTTFYAIACPAGANARDLFLTKTSSILFYQ